MVWMEREISNTKSDACIGFAEQKIKRKKGPYTKPDTVPSYDKGSHLKRSEANQPNHRKRKINK